MVSANDLPALLAANCFTSLPLESNKTLKLDQVKDPLRPAMTIEEIYYELQSIPIVNSTYTIVLSDFSAKLEREGEVKERHIGRYGISERNDRSDYLVLEESGTEVDLDCTECKK